MGDLKHLYDADSYDTRWEHNGQGGAGVRSSEPNGNWRGSSRILTVALLDPRQPPLDSNSPLIVTNFASVLLEAPPWPPAAGNFPSVRIVPVNGAPDNCLSVACAANARRLQLIE